MMLRASRKPVSSGSTSSSPPSFRESLDYLMDSDSDDYPLPAPPVEKNSSTFTKPDGITHLRPGSDKLNSNSTMNSSVAVLPTASPSRGYDLSDDSSPATQASSSPPSGLSSTNTSSKSPLHVPTGTTSRLTNTSSLRDPVDSSREPLDTSRSSGLDKALVDKKPMNTSGSHWPASGATTEAAASTFTPGTIGNSTMAVNTTLVPTNSVAFTSVAQSAKPTFNQSDIASLNPAPASNHSTADSGSKGSENLKSPPTQQSLSSSTIVAIIIPIVILLLVVISAIFYVRTRKKRSLFSPRGDSDNTSEWSFQVVDPMRFATPETKSELQRSGTTSSYESSSFSHSYHQNKDVETAQANLPYLDPAAVERLRADESSAAYASHPGATATIPVSPVKSPKSPGTPGDSQFLHIAQKFMNARHSSQWTFRSHLPSRLSTKPPATDVFVPPPEPVALPGLRSYGQNPAN